MGKTSDAPSAALNSRQRLANVFGRQSLATLQNSHASLYQDYQHAAQLR
jgi:hypothetical protein